MDIIEKLDFYSDVASEYIDEHSKWFYGIGSAIIYFAMVIPVTITSGFNLLFTVAMLFAACIIGWPMMLVYFLPFVIIKLFCYCIKHPKEAFLTTIKVILSFIALLIFVLWLRAVLYGAYEE